MGNWRRESDKEVAQLSAFKSLMCEQECQALNEQAQRIANLERLVKDAEHYVTMIAFPRNGDWWPGAPEWLARYREMFPEVK